MRVGKKNDQYPVVKVNPDHAKRLNKVREVTERKTHIRPSLNQTANAAIAFGLPELEKESGV